MSRLLTGCAIAAAFALGLPSCQFSASVETLLSPPRLTEEQEQIYQALQLAQGGTISLKYPKSGTRLSAFMVEDFDEDGADEAIVFYEANRAGAEENPLRLCLLDQKDGKWRAVTDYITAGGEVERVDVERLGSNPRKNLIISYSMVDGAERTAEVFHYVSGTLQRSLSVPFSILSIQDLNGDGQQELFTAAAAKQGSPATATVYSLDSDGNYVQSAISLPDSFTDVTRMAWGTLPEQQQAHHAIYLDGASGATTAQTAVLTYEAQQLSVVYADSPDSPISTSRPSGCQALDIDGDGEIEIPVQAAFYGYDTGAGTPSISMINWYVCRGGLLMRECSAYYAVQSGYVFIYPTRWERRVTAAPGEEEIIFYEYDQNARSADGVPVKKAELLRLAVVTDPLAADAMQQDGYLVMTHQYGNYYMAKRPETNNSLALTDSELILSLRVL